jgi:hypothetical protein
LYFFQAAGFCDRAGPLSQVWRVDIVVFFVLLICNPRTRCSTQLWSSKEARHGQYSTQLSQRTNQVGTLYVTRLQEVVNRIRMVAGHRMQSNNIMIQINEFETVYVTSFRKLWIEL